MEVITQTDKCHYCGEEVPDDQLERRTPLCFCTHVENCHHLACTACLAKYEEIKDTEITFEMMQTIMQHAAEIKGEWAGIPYPLEDMELVVEPRYPFAEAVKTGASEKAEQLREIASKINGVLDFKVVNSWYSNGSTITIFHDKKGRAHFFREPMYGGKSADLQINTIGAARAWDYEAEVTASSRLKQLIKKWPWECYMMAGSFLETSPRSNITYMFRRCRPTLAFARRGEDDLKLLAALCLHPIGYYLDSFAGAMVPTDDVIAHLLLMRADERRFWGKANQHRLWEPEAGC